MLNKKKYLESIKSMLDLILPDWKADHNVRCELSECGSDEVAESWFFRMMRLSTKIAESVNHPEWRDEIFSLTEHVKLN